MKTSLQQIRACTLSILLIGMCNSTNAQETFADRMSHEQLEEALESGDLTDAWRITKMWALSKKAHSAERKAIFEQYVRGWLNALPASGSLTLGWAEKYGPFARKALDPEDSTGAMLANTMDTRAIAMRSLTLIPLRAELRLAAILHVTDPLELARHALGPADKIQTLDLASLLGQARKIDAVREILGAKVDVIPHIAALVERAIDAGDPSIVAELSDLKSIGNDFGKSLCVAATSKLIVPAPSLGAIRTASLLQTSTHQTCEELRTGDIFSAIDRLTTNTAVSVQDVSIAIDAAQALDPPNEKLIAWYERLLDRTLNESGNFLSLYQSLAGLDQGGPKDHFISRYVNTMCDTERWSEALATMRQTAEDGVTKECRSALDSVKFRRTQIEARMNRPLPLLWVGRTGKNPRVARRDLFITTLEGTSIRGEIRNRGRVVNTVSGSMSPGSTQLATDADSPGRPDIPMSFRLDVADSMGPSGLSLFGLPSQFQIVQGRSEDRSVYLADVSPGTFFLSSLIEGQPAPREKRLPAWRGGAMPFDILPNLKRGSQLRIALPNPDRSYKLYGAVAFPKKRKRLFAQARVSISTLDGRAAWEGTFNSLKPLKINGAVPPGTTGLVFSWAKKKAPKRLVWANMVLIEDSAP